MTNCFKYALAVAVSSLGLAAGSAEAATIIFNDGSPYDEVVHANSAGAGTTLVTKTKPGGYTVNLTSADGIDAGNGDGVAIIKGLGTGQGNGFSSILVDPLVDFGKIQFKIEDFGGQLKGNDLDIRVNFAGGGFEDFTNVLIPTNSKFDIWADETSPGIFEIFDSIVISGLQSKGDKKNPATALKFKAIKQISFDVVTPGPAIPEPATWGLMILGIGAIGGVMRRQRQSLRYSIA